MPKPNIGELLKESFKEIDNIKTEVKVTPPVEAGKNIGSSKKGKKRVKKARTVCNKGEKKKKEMKVKSKAVKKSKSKAETVPFFEKSWHLDKVRFLLFDQFK